MRPVLIHILAWMPMVFIAIANGITRDSGYARFMSELRAHQLSTLIGVSAFAIYTWGLARMWPLASAQQAWTVGLVWVALTIAFEFTFGHYVVKHPWSRLFADYNLAAGRVWTLALVSLAVMPRFFHWLAQR